MNRIKYCVWNIPLFFKFFTVCDEDDVPPTYVYYMGRWISLQNYLLLRCLCFFSQHRLFGKVCRLNLLFLFGFLNKITFNLDWIF
jgi:branched-subunit amino acid transport protein AzlD